MTGRGSPHATLGARAYHLRKLTRMSWRRIADAMGYRPELGDAMRWRRLSKLALYYARVHKMQWPLPGPEDREPREAVRAHHYARQNGRCAACDAHMQYAAAVYREKQMFCAVCVEAHKTAA